MPACSIRRQQLSDAELDADRPGMFGTIRVTLLHMMQAQHSWLRRAQGLDPVEPWTAEAFPTIADLRNQWDALDAENLAYVATLTDEQLLETLHIRSLPAGKWTRPAGRRSSTRPSTSTSIAASWPWCSPISATPPARSTPSTGSRPKAPPSTSPPAARHVTPELTALPCERTVPNG